MSRRRNRPEPVVTELHEEMAKLIQEKYLDQNFEIEHQEFEILSTIRYDPELAGQPEFGADDDTTVFFLFNEHLDRLRFTLDFFKWPFDITRHLLLAKLNEIIDTIDKSLPHKLRLTVNKTGEVTITATPTSVRNDLLDGLFEDSESPCWNVYLDSTYINMSPFTSFKTTKRSHYNVSRERSLDASLPFGAPQEVLVYNTVGQIMEGSITNVAFRRKEDSKWITPNLASGCLCGVTRSFLLTKGYMEEEPILLKNVKIGDDVLLFNGIHGVIKGKICAPL